MLRAMTRRMFFAGSTCALAFGKAQPSFAITMDDVNWQQFPDPAKVNTGLITTMREHGAHLALFVIGRNAEGDPGRSLVREWRGAGHVVGNHTYSHRSYNAMSFEQFSADVAQ